MDDAHRAGQPRPEVARAASPAASDPARQAAVYGAGPASARRAAVWAGICGTLLWILQGVPLATLFLVRGTAEGRTPAQSLKFLSWDRAGPTAWAWSAGVALFTAVIGLGLWRRPATFDTGWKFSTAATLAYLLPPCLLAAVCDGLGTRSLDTIAMVIVLSCLWSLNVPIALTIAGLCFGRNWSRHGPGRATGLDPDHSRVEGT